MLNNVFVPNSLICTEPGGEIEWPKIYPYLWTNLNYNEILVNETVQYNQLRAPYVEVKSADDLKLVHQYYITPVDITTPTEAPANSMILVYSKNDEGEPTYLVLPRAQTFFQYIPTDDGYTYTYSHYNPTIDKAYLRPCGEWPVAERLRFSGSTRVLSDNEIKYYFKDVSNQHVMIASAHFVDDKVNAHLYLTSTSNECILTCPAHYNIQQNKQTGASTISLVLDTPSSLPSTFYVEVF